MDFALSNSIFQLRICSKILSVNSSDFKIVSAKSYEGNEICQP